jgi:small subunit ribosomal protein S1
VKEVDAKGAIITLADDIEATLKASEISRDRVEDARNVLKEGEEVEAKIISVDRKSRVIQLSIKSKDVEDEKEAIQSLRDKPEGKRSSWSYHSGRPVACTNGKTELSSVDH